MYNVNLFSFTHINKDLIMTVINNINNNYCFLNVCYDDSKINLFKYTNNEKINAEILINSFSQYEQFKNTIIIVDNDIYIPGFKYIFSLTNKNKQISIISINRLYSENTSLFITRLLKEILHEAGHLMGLVHCDFSCIMSFSSSPKELDVKTSLFCSSCEKKLLNNYF